MGISFIQLRKFILLPLLAAMSAIMASAQNFRQEIAENPDRAGGIFHYYEYSESPSSKVPKGYKPFYISHYGRHGSRYHTDGASFKGAVVALDSARSKRMLTDDGVLLSLQLDTLWNEHMRMFGMLTSRGAQEHRDIAARMFDKYKDVFRGERNQIDCISSFFPRCIMSMDNFTASLLGKAQEDGVKGLKIHYVAGQKYFRILCSGAHPTEEVREKSRNLSKHLNDSLVKPERFIKNIFLNPVEGEKLVGSPSDFMRQVFVLGSISANTEQHPNVFAHFTLDELADLWTAANDMIYFSLGISEEAGDCYSVIAKPIIKDFLDRADEALADGSKVAANLRFGHDSGLLPFVGTLGIEGMEQRWPSATVHERWSSYKMIPMASNFQMIFYRNRKGDVIVKMLYNERETTIPALKPWKGTYYKWPELREYFMNIMNSIKDE
jgi:hypothetical protein